MTVEVIARSRGPGLRVPTPSRVRGNDKFPAAPYLPRGQGVGATGLRSISAKICVSMESDNGMSLPTKIGKTQCD